MKTKDKDDKIIELLNEGKSYTYIQEILKVSPSKIALIKKKCKTSSSSSTSSIEFGSEIKNDSSSGNSSKNIKSSVFNNDNIDNDIQKNNKNSIETQKNNEMENYNIELEKHRLDLQHQLELKKIELQKETFELQNQEFHLKRKLADVENLKILREEKNLVFRFRKIMQKVKKGTWSYLQIEEFIESIDLLKEEIELHCFKEEIETEDLVIIKTLNHTTDFLKDYLKEIIENNNEECVDCEEYGDCSDCSNEIDEDEAHELKIKIIIDETTQKMIDESQNTELFD